MTKKEVILHVQPDGTIKCLGGDDLKPLENLGSLSKERVSHILPVNKYKKFAFKTLRYVFGETGKISNYTRSWKGPWEVTIIHSGEKFTSQNRCDCIEWETKKLGGN